MTGWLAGLVNDAVDLARDAVEGLISTITKPVIDAIRLAVGSVATVTTIVSYLKRWQAPITAPNDPDRFAVGDEPDRNGSLIVKVDSAGETDDWPPLLKDCARAVGLDLPTLSKEHMPVTWRVLWQSAADLVTFHADGPPFHTELDRTLESTLTYTTGHEDSDEGQLVTSGVEIGVSIRRTEIDRLKQLISGFLLGQVPGVVRGVVGPILQSYIDLALGHLDEITAVEGSVLLRVSHHKPPEPTTTTVPQCVSGPVIPAGAYQSRDVTGRYTLTETKPGNGVISGTIDAASIVLHSDGTATSGQISVHWAGEGDLSIAGSTSHIAEDSTLHDAVISGPVTDPVVDGTITGTVTVDGDATSGSRPVHAHLHVVGASCVGIGTDIVAMLNDMVGNDFSTVTGAATFAAPWSPA